MRSVESIRLLDLVIVIIVLALAVTAGIGAGGDGWSTSVFLSLVALDLCAIIGIYSLWGFTSETISSITLVCGAAVGGTLLGGLPCLLVMILLVPGIPWIAVLVNTAVIMFVLPITLHQLHAFMVQNLPTIRYCVIGHKDVLETLLMQVARSSPRRICFVEYMNPDCARLLNGMQAPRRFDSILIAEPTLAEKVESALAAAPGFGISIEQLPEMVEHTLKKAPPIVMQSFPDRYDTALSNPRNEVLFRAFDLVLASLLLVILLPAAVVTAVMILVLDGGPLLYTQDRHGWRGKVFRAIKFRTMVAAPEGTSGAEPLGLTRSGRFLRGTHFNEIPQLLNVLAGHMSIVGPRPDVCRTYESCTRSIPHYSLRTSVRPGLTGIAQIYYRHIESLDLDAFSERLAYDVYYIRNRTLALNLQVMLLTARNLIFRRGG